MKLIGTLECCCKDGKPEMVLHCNAQCNVMHEAAVSHLAYEGLQVSFFQSCSGSLFCSHQTMFRSYVQREPHEALLAASKISPLETRGLDRAIAG